VVYLATASALYYKLSTECVSEKVLKIGEHLAKIRTKVCSLLFLAHPYISPTCVFNFHWVHFHVLLPWAGWAV